MSDLTFVVPTAGYFDVVKSLKTLRKYTPGAKIIVVDQTVDGALTNEEVKDLTEVYIRVYRTLGFSKAMNMGLNMADTKYVCCANDDVELINEKWLDNTLSWFDKYDNLLAVNPASIKGFNGEPDHMEYLSLIHI